MESQLTIGEALRVGFVRLESDKDTLFRVVTPCAEGYLAIEDVTDEDNYLEVHVSSCLPVKQEDLMEFFGRQERQTAQATIQPKQPSPSPLYNKVSLRSSTAAVRSSVFLATQTLDEIENRLQNLAKKLVDPELKEMMDEILLLIK